MYIYMYYIYVYIYILARSPLLSSIPKGTRGTLSEGKKDQHSVRERNISLQAKTIKIASRAIVRN